MDTVYFYFRARVSDAAVNKSARVRPGQRFRLSGTLLGVELLAVRLGGWRAEGPPPFSAAAARRRSPSGVWGARCSAASPACAVACRFDFFMF